MEFKIVLLTVLVLLVGSASGCAENTKEDIKSD